MISHPTGLRTPALAVVGHPNKGKSSIVSTLVQDASVLISLWPGSTDIIRPYPIEWDGRELCRLIDTPGFQRPQAALDWMLQHSESTSDRPKTVREFVAAHHKDERFDAECQLLSPILEGAGILYVIDGSLPYNPGYDAEMEILRWTGQPSMALINRVDSGDDASDWQAPLSQYFRIIREFNAFTEPFERHVQLLIGFAELHEPWRKPLQEAADSLVARRTQQLQQSCERIVKLLEDMLTYRETVALPNPKDTASIAQSKKQFVDRLEAMEQAARLDVEAIFRHDHLKKQESELPAMDDDLLSERTLRLFGLNRDQILALGATSGAATGALIDLGAGGITLFLGGATGAIIGMTGAWVGSHQLVKVRVRGLAFGRHQTILGPIRNLQFPWIILGRALLHLRLVSCRNHAIREQLIIQHQQGQSLTNLIDPGTQKSLQKGFRTLCKGRIPSPKQRQRLSQLIQSTMESAPMTEPSPPNACFD